MGRWIFQAGLLVMAIGLIVMLLERSGFRAGRLPGDIRIGGRNGSFYFPVVTCILASLLFSLISWLLNRR